MEPAPFFGVFLIISYSEELPTAEQAKIENHIVGCAAIDIGISWLVAIIA